MEDEEIVALYWARSEQAVARTGEKYGLRLLGLARRFSRAQEDAEECVNDTYLGAWNTIPPTRPEHLFAYLCRLCRNLALNRLDWLDAQKRKAPMVELSDELTACLPDRAEERQAEGREIGRALSAFLRAQPPRPRAIFLRRYWYGDSVRDIAARLGTSESAVKASLLRTRRRLRTYLQKEEIGL